MTETTSHFDVAFRALTDYGPMKWQGRLYKRLKSQIPRACDLPTGLGKTSIIPIWLIALASLAGNESISLPRRLIYIVNRRTVVDQATGVLEQIRNRLLDPGNPSWRTHAHVLVQLANQLRKLSAGLDDLPLAVSTMRGELADNAEWKVDPARAVIVVGTIDMIGSKLLFSGYGDGKYHCPHHAGLIGQDALIVHDEAHLTPAFSELLCGIAEAQRRTDESRPVHTIELSATARGNDDENVLSLVKEDEQDKIVQQRLNAKKSLRLHVMSDTDLTKMLVELARKHNASASKVLLYIRSPDSAFRIVNELRKQLGNESASRIALLTGTIRGYERDRLVQENSVYLSFLEHDLRVEQTVYLVSTSAGEVGIDLDADHLVCDLTTLDSMIQRLGRVNRHGGEDRLAEVDVVVDEGEANAKDKASEFDKAMRATQTILRRLPLKADDTHDASPRSLRDFLKGLEEGDKSKAFSPKSEAPPLTDILLDAWSLTSISKPMPGRPEVAPYLHGLTNDPPETYVAWRKEVALLDDPDIDAETLRDWFHACRIEARERLRDSTDRVRDTLRKLLEKHRKEGQCSDLPVVLLNERGEAERSRLSKIVEKEVNLAYRTVVLPVEAGGLTTPYGTLDGSVVDPATDVADTVNEKGGEGRRERWLLIEAEDGERWERFLTGETARLPSRDLREMERATLQAPSEGAEKEEEAQHLVLMVSLQRSVLEDPEIARTEQTLEQHSRYIKGHARSIAKALKLDRELEEALITAAWWHDQGKARPVWQRFACNPNMSEPLAKSPKYLHGRALGGYRHEFGSLLDAATHDTVQNHSERDLILHLIAAHHGWARPHFESTAWDPPPRTTRENENAVAETMRRFGRLQQRFGRWGLAWLESLLRCADIAASKQVVDVLMTSQSEEIQA